MSMSGDDLTEEILDRFEANLREMEDISARTEDGLNNSENRKSFGDDERLLEQLTGVEDR
jgi:hypothetical protein